MDAVIKMLTVPFAFGFILGVMVAALIGNRGRFWHLTEGDLIGEIRVERLRAELREQRRRGRFPWRRS